MIGSCFWGKVIVLMTKDLFQGVGIKETKTRKNK